MTLQSKWTAIGFTRLILTPIILILASVSAAAQTNTFPSSGNAGVNTTSPPNPLTVVRSGSAPYTNRPAYELLQLVDKTDNTPQMVFGSTYNGMLLRYTGTDGTAANQRLGVLTGGGVEAFVINNDGNIGIGTTNPSRLLSLSAATNPAVSISNPGISYTSNQLNAFGANQSEAGMFTLSNNSTGALWFRSFNNSMASGIGSYFSSFSENDLTTFSSFEFVAKKHNGAGALVNHGNSARIFSVLNNTTNLFNVMGSGNVGIGTTTPASNLQIGSQTSVASANPTALSLGASYSNSAGANLKLKLYDDGVADNTYGIGVSYGSMDFRVYSSAGYKWYAGDMNKMTLTSNGDLSVSGNIAAKYQDLAEWVPSSEQLTAGTVVVLDTTKSNQVISSTVSYDTRVAGVISAQPGITLGEGGEGKVLVATTGRVRVKVDASRGAIQIGDLLVTSDVTGVAMKSEAVEFAGRKMHMPGTIIGKALEPLAKGSGEILVLLSLQ